MCENCFPMCFFEVFPTIFCHQIGKYNISLRPEVAPHLHVHTFQTSRQLTPLDLQLQRNT